MNFLKQVVLFITLLSSFTSCGPSESEIKAKEQKLIDSVAKVTETTTINKLKDQQKAKEDLINKEKIEITLEKDKAIITDFITTLTTELEVQKTKLEDIKAPKLLRPISEKENQVRTQLTKISNIKSKLDEAISILQKINSGKKYQLPIDLISISDTSTIVLPAKE